MKAGREERDEWSVTCCQQPLYEGPRVTGGENDNAHIVRGPAAQDWKVERKEGRTQRPTDGQRRKKKIVFFFMGILNAVTQSHLNI